MKITASLITLILYGVQALASEPAIIRVGVQATGTLAWELAVMKREPQFKTGVYQLEIHELANPEAGKIALQSGGVDIIITDWIWVSKIRSEGKGGYEHAGGGKAWVAGPPAQGSDLAYYPYSSASGSLIVAEVSPIKSVKDLPGKKLGIAGGELDKNWLLLQALASRENIDLDKTVEKVFGAPPLIEAQLKQGRIDAALTYWHFAARLKPEGYRDVLDGKAILNGLGVDSDLPVIGYVFNKVWAIANKATISAFLKDAAGAKDLLCQSEPVWQSVLPLVKAKDGKVQNELRRRYCDGRVALWGEKERQEAEKVYAFLKQVSGGQLTGKSDRIGPGTFWLNE